MFFVPIQICFSISNDVYLVIMEIFGCVLPVFPGIAFLATSYVLEIYSCGVFFFNVERVAAFDVFSIILCHVFSLLIRFADICLLVFLCVVVGLEVNRCLDILSV